MEHNGQKSNQSIQKTSGNRSEFDDFVLDKSIFSNIFEKDIQRVYLYKKSERLAKALYLILPAFKDAPALRDRVHRISIELIDASILTPLASRDALSRALLALSSVLSIARSAGLLSPMNAELISREAHLLLKEAAVYEEPKLSFEDAPTLAVLSRNMPSLREPARDAGQARPKERSVKDIRSHVSDTGSPLGPDKTNRREAILATLRSKGPSFIKDISTVVRDVSEKTIQRELQALVLEGRVTKTGERRWTSYTIV
jgi:hypothetical protein